VKDREKDPIHELVLKGHPQRRKSKRKGKKTKTTKTKRNTDPVRRKREGTQSGERIILGKRMPWSKHHTGGP